MKEAGTSILKPMRYKPLRYLPLRYLPIQYQPMAEEQRRYTQPLKTLLTTYCFSKRDFLIASVGADGLLESTVNFAFVRRDEHCRQVFRLGNHPSCLPSRVHFSCLQWLYDVNTSSSFTAAQPRRNRRIV